MRPIANAHHHIDRLLELLAMERRADLEQYRAKVTNRSLQNRVKEGSTWYPVRLRRNYVGTGERNILELERTNHLEQAHLFQSGKTVNIFSNGSGKPERDHLGGVVNYVSDNVITITINSEDLPDWIDDSLLGIDVMFDEMTYREMEYALKTVAKAEDSRLAVLRDLFMGNSDLQTAKEKMQAVENWATDRPAARMEALTAPLNDPQKRAVDISQNAPAVSLVHGPPGTGKTTTLVEIICNTL
ncbi:MAG: AAA domain-containing protein, partial [Bacteroidota bacterium]